ncbi:Hypothetical predicted protein [Xyrichtys novacula]|uniref:Secreted protein n=1 Tax=Xyrichtys novacula TaxID=13765 RepID=A0AAV1HEM7_XYRNO|nr:Hypothetical predicted protein [Xyrichtys novacula]
MAVAVAVAMAVKVLSQTIMLEFEAFLIVSADSRSLTAARLPCSKHNRRLLPHRERPALTFLHQTPGEHEIRKLQKPEFKERTESDRRPQ